jgi:hypothetical protein
MVVVVGLGGGEMGNGKWRWGRISSVKKPFQNTFKTG